MTALRVLAPGPFTTLQDGGRQGWLRFGVPASGALDPRALAIANLVAGNKPDQGALEMTLAGGSFVAEGAVRVAVAGADMAMTIDGIAAALHRSHTLAPGAMVRLGTMRHGARAYLAVSGGFAVAPVFGSVSTHVRSGIGGFAGRALRAGDVLQVAGPPPAEPDRRIDLEPPPIQKQLGVVLGPQADRFTDAAVATLLASDYSMTARSDRMVCRLTGPALDHAGDFNAVSDAIAPGSIQVPGGGEPLILLADGQTTGGYPKIATVISADLPALGQMRPGDTVRFAAVTLDAAREARRALLAWMAALAHHIRPVDTFDSEALLGANLISGVIDGAAP